MPDTIILIVVTPRMVPLILGNPQLSALDASELRGCERMALLGKRMLSKEITPMNFDGQPEPVTEKDSRQHVQGCVCQQTPKIQVPGAR